MHSDIGSFFGIKLKQKPPVQQQPINQQTDPRGSFLKNYEELTKQRKATQQQLRSKTIKSMKSLQGQAPQSQSVLRTIKSMAKQRFGLKMSDQSFQSFKKYTKTPSKRIRSMTQTTNEISSSRSQSSSRRIAFDPQNLLKSSTFSKVSAATQCTYVNVILNKKLEHQLSKKNDLEKFVQQLKNEILKETHANLRINKENQSLTNQQHHTNGMLLRIGQQRQKTKDQIAQCKSDLKRQAKICQKLGQARSRNSKTLKRENRLIQDLQKQKSSLKELNIVRDYQLQQKNRLMKTETQFQQASLKSDKVCHSISINARRAMGQAASVL